MAGGAGVLQQSSKRRVAPIAASLQLVVVNFC